MSKRKQNHPAPHGASRIDKWLPSILVAVIGMIGVIVVALINRSTMIETTLKPIAFTQTAEALRTPTLNVKQAHLALEAVGISTTVYSGEAVSSLGNSKATLSTMHAENGATQYWMDYDLPTSGEFGEVVLEFRFQQLQDLTPYKFIQFTLDFVRPEAQVGFYFENENEDARGDTMFLSPSTSLPEIRVTPLQEQRYRFEIPLEKFSNTNMSNVREIGLYMSSDFLSGESKLMIGEVLFLPDDGG